MCKQILTAFGILSGLAWLCFTVYTGIMLFGTEANIECIAEESGSLVNVAYRFNVVIILIFSSQIGIIVSILILIYDVLKI